MIRRYQAVLLVATLLLAGCSQKGVIPARKMSLILHDMYVLDAQLAVDREYALKADTTSVYGSVFADYGCTQEDFARSLDYYLQNPVKFKEVFEMAHKRFESEVGDVELDPAGMLFDEVDDPVEKAGRMRARRNRGRPAPDGEK
ncbi:MAG: DUF4296 domain-containing protein [Bacteroidales bacterium]|nr:DUF4296 domain-containing protein [Bacteroidales bacterium]